MPKGKPISGGGDDMPTDDAYMTKRDWERGPKRALAALPRLQRARIGAITDAAQLLDSDYIRGGVFGSRKKRDVITGSEAKIFVESMEKNRAKLGLSGRSVDTLKNAFKKRMR